MLNTIQRGWSYGRVVLISFMVLGLVCGCAAEPQSLGWSEQVNLLRARAIRHDSEAVLYLCIATEPDSYNETLTVADDESLMISCDFMSPDGTTFRLRYDDLRVRGTLELTSVRGELEWVNPSAMRTLQRAQGAVQIGPREALVAAQPHSVQFREKAGPLMFSTAILHVGEFSMQRANLPAIWSISHYSFSKETEQIWVSAIDGTIVERAESEE